MSGSFIMLYYFSIRFHRSESAAHAHALAAHQISARSALDVKSGKVIYQENVCPEWVFHPRAVKMFKAASSLREDSPRQRRHSLARRPRASSNKFKKSYMSMKEVANNTLREWRTPSKAKCLQRRQKASHVMTSSPTAPLAKHGI